MSIEKFAKHVNQRNENRRKDYLKKLVIVVESQAEKTYLGESQIIPLREQFETYKNLKLVDKLEDLKEQILKLNEQEGKKAATQFMLINHAVRHDYCFELN